MSDKRIKAHYFALLVPTSFLLTLSVAHGEVTPRIINGSTSFTATYPWMASITVISADGLFEGECGGSLIAQTGY